MKNDIIDVIIPAYNEEASIGKVISDIPKSLIRHIVVSNNNSTDDTGSIAQQHGAIVVQAKQKGYGNACLTGLAYLQALPQPPDIVVFLDGDYSDYPEQMTKVVAPIQQNRVDLVIGSRVLGHLKKGAMQPHQIFGNWLATRLISLIYGYKFTDLGPFRAIRWTALEKIKMEDRNFGWTVEMQVKAAKHQLRATEVAVDYRHRIGVSKVSGTIKGSILAGQKIIWTIFKYL